MSNSEDRRAIIKSAWLRWFALWIPLMMAILVASVWLEFNSIMGGVTALLVGVLLYQRIINKRSWRSILWGVHAKDE
ncbi:MAG TPA: hypothetical protein VLA37_06005 [Sphingomonadaceae bacterium]|nr:hypothetical protein [Sphingomonadaceae bacterium]